MSKMKKYFIKYKIKKFDFARDVLNRLFVPVKHGCVQIDGSNFRGANTFERMHVMDICNLQFKNVFNTDINT